MALSFTKNDWDLAADLLVTEAGGEIKVLQEKK